jgi:uncharacterized protein
VRKVVFDTNIYISALITQGGRAEEAWMLALEGRVEVYTSAAILSETAGKLREKFHWDDEWIKRAVRHIAVVARVVKPDARFAILKDEPDNRILECARHTGAEVIVTGDRHLLSLVSFEGIRIVTLADFLEQERAATAFVGK